MTDLETSPLLPRPVFDDLMAEVASRVGAVELGPSKYRTLAELASIYHAYGNRLSLLIYQASSQAGGQHLACFAGCSVCCKVPSDVRAKDKRNYSMSYLDMIWLVENYAEMRSANPSVNRKAFAAAAEARRTEALQPCPHLTESGGCGIYAHRPLPCKIWFSADLSLCVQNRDLGYEAGVNPVTQLSRSIELVFAQPFEAYVERIDPDQEFWGHDFLAVFEEIGKFDERGLFDVLRDRIDAGELASWNPFV